MRNLDYLLKKRTINIEQLIDYGFVLKNNQFILKKLIYHHQFEMIVVFSSASASSRLIELENNEEYILVDVKKASGEFVNKVKEEYENILNDIIEKCTTYNAFQNPQTLEIIKYIKDTYQDELEYLWKKSDNAIWRNKKNNKWYGALLLISQRKLGIDSDHMVEIIDLRFPKNQINDFIDHQKIYPGYHMNKNNWITIKLDYSVDTQTICQLINNSYQLSLKK